jgi:hypothetical protein
MRYGTTTRLAPAEAITAADELFGKEYGLTVQERSQQKIRFEGGGGHVLISVASENPTSLDIETREWDRLVVSFMEHLPR